MHSTCSTYLQTHTCTHICARTHRFRVNREGHAGHRDYTGASQEVSEGVFLPSYHPPPSHPIGSTSNPFVIMELAISLGCNMVRCFMGRDSRLGYSV